MQKSAKGTARRIAMQTNVKRINSNGQSQQREAAKVEHKIAASVAFIRKARKILDELWDLSENRDGEQPIDPRNLRGDSWGELLYDARGFAFQLKQAEDELESLYVRPHVMEQFAGSN